MTPSLKVAVLSVTVTVVVVTLTKGLVFKEVEDKPQLSEAEGLVQEYDWVQAEDKANTLFAGQFVHFGFSVSVTVTVCVQTTGAVEPSLTE